MNEQNNKYSCFILEKMLNLLMSQGKKQVAQGILTKALENSYRSLKLDKTTTNLLTQVIFNVSPDLEIKSKKVGTNIYQIPRSITMEKKLKLGIKNLLESARSRKEYTMCEKLSAEIIDAYNFKGLSIKRKEEIHKMAEINKSYAHFNW
jgi:small subunit ribosomal protein S7